MDAEHVRHLEEHGYAVVRGFLEAGEVSEIRSAVQQVYELAMTHPCTFRHRNLAFEILNDSGAGHGDSRPSALAEGVDDPIPGEGPMVIATVKATNPHPTVALGAPMSVR